jgi:hypothetical protein
MSEATPLAMTLLPGGRELLGAHALALPQKDDLCGAFCGALALAAAGVRDRDGRAVDQDAVALAAGSVISPPGSHGSLPHGEPGRRDYRLALAQVQDPERSGTTAAGVAAAVEELSAGALRALPFAGPWIPRTLAGTFDRLAELERPASMIANLATRHLWGGRPSVLQLLAHLEQGGAEGPEPDWDVGHFACVVGRIAGPGGALYCVADTYPALGDRGVHLQPTERLALAIARPDMPSGGAILVVAEEDAAAVREHAQALGLAEGLWDNGTVAQEMLA